MECVKILWLIADRMKKAVNIMGFFFTYGEIHCAAWVFSMTWGNLCRTFLSVAHTVCFRVLIT